MVRSVVILDDVIFTDLSPRQSISNYPMLADRLRPHRREGAHARDEDCATAFGSWGNVLHADGNYTLSVGGGQYENAENWAHCITAAFGETSVSFTPTSVIFTFSGHAGRVTLPWRRSRA